MKSLIDNQSSSDISICSERGLLFKFNFRDKRPKNKRAPKIGMAQQPQAPDQVSYDFADAVPLPGDIGVRDGNSMDQLVSNVKGVNYYVDFIAFGDKSLLNDRDVVKPGLRSFQGTGMMCPNGAEMNVYRDSVTKGDILGEKVKQGLQSAGLPAPAGVAPGIMEDARDALNPFPLFSAAMASGYPDCRLITLPVGDLYGRTKPDVQRPGGNTTWLEGPVDPGWPPRQTKWVQKLDRNGYPIYLSEEQFNRAPKTHNFDGFPKKPAKEKFSGSFDANVANKLVALSLLVALAASFSLL